MLTVILLNNLHASSHIPGHIEHTNTPAQRQHSVEMPQTVQSIFVTVTVTNDASQKQNLIKLIDQSDNPAAITHHEQPIISASTTPPRQQSIDRLGRRSPQYHITLACFAFDFETIISTSEIVFERLKIANFKIVRLPYPHAGIGEDQDVVGQQPTCVQPCVIGAIALPLNQSAQ